MATFPGMTLDFLMWKQTLPQVMNWFNMALEIRTGKEDKGEERPPDEGEFTFNEQTGKWE